jgi:hypothetical protein
MCSAVMFYHVATENYLKKASMLHIRKKEELHAVYNTLRAKAKN